MKNWRKGRKKVVWDSEREREREREREWKTVKIRLNWQKIRRGGAGGGGGVVIAGGVVAGGERENRIKRGKNKGKSGNKKHIGL